MQRCLVRARRLALGLAGSLCLAAPVSAAGWGNIKGQVVCDGPVPAAKNVAVTKDEDHCLAKGPIPSEKYVINPRNKGVRWVVVWLQDPESPRKAPPINPRLKAVSPRSVEIDQHTAATTAIAMPRQSPAPAIDAERDAETVDGSATK